MSDAAGSGRSKRRKSRLGRKEYPVGKPVAPPPGWNAPAPRTPPPEIHERPAPPPPPDVPVAAPPVATWVPPAPEPAPEAPLTTWDSPPAAANVAESAVEPPVRPVMLNPNSAPIWAPLPREAEPSPEMSYNLTEPPAPPMPVSYGMEPLLTPAAKIGLALVVVLLLVGAGLFVFHDGFRKIKSGGDRVALGDAAPAPEPQVTPAPVVPVPPPPTPTPEKKPEPTPEKNPEPKVDPMPDKPETPDKPDKPEKKPILPPESPSPVPRPDPLRAVPIFEADILPIFQSKCIACHGARKRGGVDVRSVDALVGKGEEDGVLVRGSITKSKLWRAINTDKMPKVGKKLTDDEKEQVRRWIMGGAKSVRKTPTPALPSSSNNEATRER